MFRRNVGGIDRVLRVTLGGILTVAGLLLLAGKSSLGVIVGVVGLLALLTGLIRFCVLYLPLGISTARPGGQRINQMCCGVPMAEMQAKCTSIRPSASSEKGARDMAVATGQKR